MLTMLTAPFQSFTAAREAHRNEFIRQYLLDVASGKGAMSRAEYDNVKRSAGEIFDLMY